MTIGVESRPRRDILTPAPTSCARILYRRPDRSRNGQGRRTPVRTSYTDARARLAGLIERAVQDRETIIITRRGKPEVALIAADELAGLQETAHLLRSPKNAERLLRALRRALARKGKPRSVETLRKALGLERQ
ncbi:MAG: type II toxin-antitoxin system Phd/YefM family antitoxin [Armatimonadota bacterium]|nr:type II toxin-antitoxin system Phd/YefM family antitoxin [Armatimonadota bacterium]